MKIFKLFYFILIFLIAFLNLYSQKYNFLETVSYDEWQRWMKSIKMPLGYSFYGCNIEGENSKYLEYSGNFVNDTVRGAMIVRLTSINNFDLQYCHIENWISEGEYDLDGKQVIFISSTKPGTTGIQTGMGIRQPSINASITILIMADTAYKKPDMESIAKAIGMNRFDTIKVVYPPDIPSDYRVPGTALKIYRDDAKTEGIEAEYHVFFAKTADWVKEVKEFMNDIDGTLESTEFDNWVLICKDAGSFEYLINKPDWSQIEFIYYKLKK
jgi:hypothetical protein